MTVSDGQPERVRDAADVRDRRRVLVLGRQMLEEDRQNERAWVEKITEQSTEILRNAGIKVTCVLREGDPKQELCKAAEEWNADCIFVGSAGFSNRLERFVLGSISGAVAARAHCSVEVIRKST